MTEFRTITFLAVTLSRLRYQRNSFPYGHELWFWYDAGMRTVEAVMERR
jgi:hypothetical protein